MEEDPKKRYVGMTDTLLGDAFAFPASLQSPEENVTIFFRASCHTQKHVSPSYNIG